MRLNFDEALEMDWNALTAEGNELIGAVVCDAATRLQDGEFKKGDEAEVRTMVISGLRAAAAKAKNAGATDTVVKEAVFDYLKPLIEKHELEIAHFYEGV